MRDLDSRRLVSRVTGRQALEARLRRLIIAAARFGERRAVTDVDRRWSGRVIDALRAVLNVNDRGDGL